MYRVVGILTVTMLSGCTSLGQLDVLNDLGHVGKTTGHVLRTVDSSCKVLTGHSCDRPVDRSQANRTYGEVKQLPYYRNAPLADKINQIKQFW